MRPRRGAAKGKQANLHDPASAGGIDRGYLIGLAVFSLTVVGYTMIGGFLASVWTDMFQSVLMALGVLFLFCLVVPAASKTGWGQATDQAVVVTGPEFASGPGFSEVGHNSNSDREFLPPTLALSYFVVWIFGGIGAPTGMVRLMATKDSRTLRRSIVLLSFYNLLIYLPLLVIWISARSIFPTLESSEEVVRGWRCGRPRLARRTFWGGLILAAPFGAVMATVSSYLVLIASGLVHDVYQRFFRPGETRPKSAGPRTWQCCCWASSPWRPTSIRCDTCRP